MNKEQIDPRAYSEEQYDIIFENTYTFLKKKKTVDLDNEIQLLETTLESLMVYSGNDWVGRGESSANRLSAQIAATEILLLELKEMKNAKVELN